jgi:hypothetical protein
MVGTAAKILAKSKDPRQATISGHEVETYLSQQNSGALIRGLTAAPIVLKIATANYLV